MKTHHHPARIAAGFTLAEVTIAMGIAAGVLAILSMVMGALSRDVRRLKPYEAWGRPAFVGKSSKSTSTNSSQGSSSTPTNTPPTTPTNSLPDANLDPNTRPAEGTVPPDPDDPASTTPKTNGTGTSNGTSGTSTP